MCEEFVHGLLGANGAGKTTLLKVLATLVVPETGRARVAGFDVVAEPQRVRAVVGLVLPEDRSFYWRLTGRQNLHFFASLHDLRGTRRRDAVDELIEVVGLQSHADRPFREYSAGMKQRLSIARGLLGNPRVLLMDEPTRGLDPPAARWLRAFVRERLVRQRGAAVVLATHDMLEAETTCDRLSLVDRGLVVAEGTVTELKRPLDRAARTRLTLLAPDDALVRAVRDGAHGAGLEVHEAADCCEVLVAGSPEVVAGVVSRLAAAGARIAAVRPQEEDLSALFERVARPAEPAGSRR